MRLGWHKWWLFAVVATACSLDPQPQIPGDRTSTGGQVSGVGGATSINVGDNSSGTGNTLNTSTGGSNAGAAPDAGPPVVAEGGAPGEAGAANEAGASGETDAGGATAR